MPARLDIIIVNWNTGGELRACLDSIVGAGRGPFDIDRVVVVDNASSDGSCDALAHPALRLHVIRNRENRGFAAACNQGAAGSRADYLLFLNPDTRLAPDSLSRPVAFMEEETARSVGICGVRLVDDRGDTTTSCARFPTLRTFFANASGLSRLRPRRWPSHLMTADECRETRDVDQVIGAFFLIRRHLFEVLGGFDQRFFVYFEEVDLSLRVRQRGYRSVLLADVTAYHRGGASSDQVRAVRLFYSLRSRLLYAFKHYSALEAALLVAVTVGLELPSRVALALARRSLTDVKETLQAYMMLTAYFGQRAIGRTADV